MKPLYNQDEFKKAKYKDVLPLECYCCGKQFWTQKKRIKDVLSENTCDVVKYCGVACVGRSQNKSVEVTCDNCGSKVRKMLAEAKRNNLHFCNKSCQATYRNTHKTKGIRRSKLEIWIESRIGEIYPGLPAIFNGKDAIESELDIYFPTLYFAVELNGLFHYEPIFGFDKLQCIKNNDKRKFQACIERGIELCVIDTSQLTYLKIEKAEVILNVICDIVGNKLKENA